AVWISRRCDGVKIAELFFTGECWMRNHSKHKLLCLMALLPVLAHAQELINRYRLSPGWARGDVLNDELRNLAGGGAENCGRVPVGHDPKPWTDCGLKAFYEKRAFYVRYDVDRSPIKRSQPLVGAFGIASDGSSVYQVEFWFDQEAPLGGQPHLIPN